MISNITPNLFVAFKSTVSKQSGNAYNQSPSDVQVQSPGFKKNHNGLLITTSLLASSAIALFCLRNKIWKNLNKEIHLPDMAFHLSIAKTLKCKPEHLKSVVGVNEFKEILNSLKPENYEAGADFCANLHIHTVKSDGRLEIANVLQQAVERAAKSGKTFIFSITDHDVLEGTQEAIRLISQEPNKYKNIKFVPGIELNSQYYNGQSFNSSIQLEILGYGFNPFDTKLTEFISSIRSKNIECATSILTKLNSLEPSLCLSMEDASSKFKHLQYGGSPGIMHNLKAYMMGALNDKGLAYKYDKDFVKTLIKEHSTEHFNIMSSTPVMEDAIKAFKDAGGLASIAHPARTDLSKGIKNGQSHADAMTQLIMDHKNYGGEAIEHYYQSYNLELDWWNKIAKAYEAANIALLKTGSFDTHGMDIGLR